MDIKELGVMSMWTGFNWLRRRSSGGFLWTFSWTQEFYKRLGTSRLDERLSASSVRLLHGVSS
jgi:hypothetical protein